MKQTIFLREILKQYLQQLALSKSELTVRCYRGDLESFIEWLEKSHGLKRVDSLKTPHILGYLTGLRVMGKKEATIQRHHFSIGSFCRWLHKMKFAEEDPGLHVEVPRVQMKAPRVPTLDEIQLIIAQANVETEAGLRDRTILELLYSSGLRASELCALQVHHVVGNSVTISCGKRNKSRTIPLTQEAQEWVELYISRYRKNATGQLFVTVQGKKITASLLNVQVKKYAQLAGIEGVTTHTLRHACATHLLDNGADIRLIQEILGHASINSTQRYTHLSSGKMQEMFQQFHPRADN